MLQMSSMPSDIQLRIPAPHRSIDHQRTILVSDDVDTSTSAIESGPIALSQLSATSDNMSPDCSVNEPKSPEVVTPDKSVNLIDLTSFNPHTDENIGEKIVPSSKQEKNKLKSPKPNEKIKYGELLVLGYNGSLATGDRGRKRSKFSMYRRPAANGVKPATKHVFSDIKDCQTFSGNSDLHSISYTLSRSQHVIVQYVQDEDTDMFQIGRSSESPIDCIIMDTVPARFHNRGEEYIERIAPDAIVETPDGAWRGVSGAQRNSPEHQIAQSTISRFSCRICIDRKPPYTARIYAAGFDSKKNIFLGEKATKWYSKNTTDVDGLTTNGVLVLHPRGEFSSRKCQPGIWREVSVGGGIYNLRETRSVPSKNQSISTESNILKDGTLIDLCGATLVWRSAEGLQHSPTSHLLEQCIERINASRPMCPVGLNTLVLPKRGARQTDKSKQPFVYLACGHVHGEHAWGQGQSVPDARKCPMCLKVGPFVQVQVGMETSLYNNSEPLTHAFTPCVHMASEQTVRYWSSVVIPFGCQGFRPMCPFCATPLTGSTGFLKLIFQDNTEF